MKSNVEAQRIRAAQVAKLLDEKLSDLVDQAISEGCTYPCCSACWTEPCVEPDGECKHGHPSILLALRLI